MAGTISRSPEPKPGRLHSLDGLRGVAASIVLLHHSLLLVPTFSATYLGGGAPSVGSVVWWLSYTPLKLFTAGGESVIVFFVLSGLVVSRPVFERATFDWYSYFPQRVLRLVLPIFGSIALAAVLIGIVPQNPFQGPGTWLTTYSTPQPNLGMFLSAVNLFGDGASFHVNNPLWSLRWELYFSLALPLFVILALIARRRWVTGVATAVVLTVFGKWMNFEPLAFFPSFFLGALLAVKLKDFGRVAGRINTRRSRDLIWSGITVAGLGLLVASWLTGPLPSDLRRVTLALQGLAPLGACVIVLACIGWGLMGRFLSSSVAQTAGKLSFSLYLTHVPVLIFVSYLLRGRPLASVILVGDLMAIAVAFGFYWLVESRSHALSRQVGRWASKRFDDHHAKSAKPQVAIGD